MHDGTTIAITNRALSPESTGLGVFVKTAKSFDLAFREVKIKTKYKSFGYGPWGMFGACPPPYLP
ncbi:hypothetical protein [Arenibacter latericius]|uniref:hypothetical protein n=1 Tax=Arenibacter latericius TaxID=86104 RepID=UPI0003FF3EF5|nr:hypothetical protein [Arenibacter latericius]